MWMLSLKFAEKTFAAEIQAACAAAAFAPKLALKFAVKAGVMTIAAKDDVARAVAAAYAAAFTIRKPLEHRIVVILSWVDWLADSPIAKQALAPADAQDFARCFWSMAKFN